MNADRVVLKREVLVGVQPITIVGGGYSLLGVLFGACRFSSPFASMRTTCSPRQIEFRVRRAQLMVSSPQVRPGMLGRLLHLDMQIGATGHFRDGVAGLAPFGIGAATGAGPLRIAAVVLDEPRSGFQQFEMR